MVHNYNGFGAFTAGTVPEEEGESFLPPSFFSSLLPRSQSLPHHTDFSISNLNPKELQLLIKKIKIKSLSPSQSPTFSLSSPLPLSPLTIILHLSLLTENTSLHPSILSHGETEGNTYTDRPFTSFFRDRPIPQTGHTRSSSPINISLSSPADYHEQQRSSNRRHNGSSHRQLQNRKESSSKLSCRSKSLVV